MDGCAPEFEINSSANASEKRTHLFYEFRRAGALWLFVRKADEARHCIDLKSRQLQEYFDLKSRYSGYDLKSYPCPLASILNRGENFLPHVRPKGRTTSEPRENRRPITGSGSVLILYLQLFCSQSCRNTRASSIKQPSSTLTFTTSPGTPRSTV